MGSAIASAAYIVSGIAAFLWVMGYIGNWKVGAPAFNVAIRLVTRAYRVEPGVNSTRQAFRAVCLGLVALFWVIFTFLLWPVAVVGTYVALARRKCKCPMHLGFHNMGCPVLEAALKPYFKCEHPNPTGYKGPCRACGDE